MKKTMREISVETTNNGEISIQGITYDGDAPTVDCVTISMDQVDTLIRWIQEAKKELQGN